MPINQTLHEQLEGDIGQSLWARKVNPYVSVLVRIKSVFKYIEYILYIDIKNPTKMAPSS